MMEDLSQSMFPLLLSTAVSVPSSQKTELTRTSMKCSRNASESKLIASYLPFLLDITTDTKREVPLSKNKISNLKLTYVV